MARKYWP
ncbi:hypothetical protein YPPY88_1332, partial [Yersinia pestis PY-88]